jgi:hypothetical protein
MLSKMTSASLLPALSLVVLVHAGGCSALKLSARSVSAVAKALREEVAAAQDRFDLEKKETIREARPPPKGASFQKSSPLRTTVKNKMHALSFAERMQLDIDARQKRNGQLDPLDTKADELAWRRKYEEDLERLKQILQDIQGKSYLKPLKDMTSEDIDRLLSENGGKISSEISAKLRTLPDLNAKNEFLSLKHAKLQLGPLQPPHHEGNLTDSLASSSRHSSPNGSVHDGEDSEGRGADELAVDDLGMFMPGDAEGGAAGVMRSKLRDELDLARSLLLR